jgi:DNA polymerase-3 subunit alpha
VVDLGEERGAGFAETIAGAAIISDRERGQASLFGMLDEPTDTLPEAIEKLPEWPQHDMLAAEKELLGFYVSGHPLSPYAPLIDAYALTNSKTAAELESRSPTRIAGMVDAVQKGVSKKSNKPYAMATLEDLEGTFQLLCLGENYDKYEQLLEKGTVLLVTGEANTDEDPPKIFPDEIIRIEDAPRKYTKQVHLRLHTANIAPEKMDDALELVTAHRGPIPLWLCMLPPTGEVVFIETHDRYNVQPSIEFQREVDELFGDDTYYAKADHTLPERQKKPWERGGRNGNGNGRGNRD